MPLIALLLSFDAVAGEAERGTLLLLLAHPVARWQVVAGKFLGHLAVLVVATLVGYGGATAAAVAVRGGSGAAAWGAFALLLGSTVLLGGVFLGLGLLASVLRARAPDGGRRGARHLAGRRRPLRPGAHGRAGGDRRRGPLGRARHRRS